MRKATIDFTKLLGFDAVSEEIKGAVDFQDETVAAKLGAKIGVDPPGQPPAQPKTENK